MKAKRLVLGFLAVCSSLSLFVVKPAQAGYVNIDDEIRHTIYSNTHVVGDDRYDHRNRHCRKERRILYEYDRDGYYRPVTRRVEYCHYTRRNNFRHAAFPLRIYRSHRNLDRYHNHNGNLQIRIGF
jgi:hypothetical protein